MIKAVIFDMDGTLIDSVDLHAWAWHDALAKFGHRASLLSVRKQIGKGGDQLLPVFLSKAEQDDYGKDLEAWRGKHFKSDLLRLVRPFAGVPALLTRIRQAGIAIAVASSAKQDELKHYLAIAEIADLVDVVTTSDDAEHSKPDPDIFESALKKLGVNASQAIAIGDSPFDAQAAQKLALPAMGVLCGGFAESDLRQSGCMAIWQSPSALLAEIELSPILCGSAMSIT